MKLADQLSRLARTEHPRWIFFALPLLVTLVAFFGFSVNFETNDDVGMALLTAGKGIVSAPTGMLVFSSGVLVGFPLATLSSWMPSIPWYALYICLVYFTAACAFTAAFTRFTRSGLALASWALFLVGVALPLCHRVHYTTGAFALGLSAIALTWSRVWKIEDRFAAGRDGILAALLLVAAHAARDRVTPMLLAFAVATTLPFLVADAKQVRLRLAFFAGVLLFAILSIGVLELADRAYFDRPGWQGARETDRLRAGITDYDYLPNYALVGWNENDYRLFKWDFSWDEPLYSTDKLRVLHEDLARNRPKRQSRWLKYFWRSNWNDPHTSLTLFVVFFCTLALMAIGAAWPIWASLGAGLFSTASAIVYLILSWRLPPWVFQSLLMMLAAQSLFCATLAMAQAKNQTQRRRLRAADAIVFCGLVWLVLFSVLLLARETGQMKGREALAVKARAEIAALKPRTVLIWGNAWPFEAAPLFSDFAARLPERAFWISCYTRLPFSRQRLAELGSTDLYDHLLEKDVYLMVSKRPGIADHVTKFLADHRGKQARAIRVLRNELHDLYRFVPIQP